MESNTIDLNIYDLDINKINTLITILEENKEDETTEIIKKVNTGFATLIEIFKNFKEDEANRDAKKLKDLQDKASELSENIAKLKKNYKAYTIAINAAHQLGNTVNRAIDKIEDIILNKIDTSLSEMELNPITIITAELKTAMENDNLVDFGFIKDFHRLYTDIRVLIERIRSYNKDEEFYERNLALSDVEIKFVEILTYKNSIMNSCIKHLEEIAGTKK